MELISGLIDLILHLDVHLQSLVATYGTWVYLILFLIVFCETGLVVTPFLPGDSLLFVAGAIAAGGAIDVHTVFAVLVVASFTGDNTNYWIGRFIGLRLFTRPNSKIFNPKHLAHTQAFYEKHGGKTVTIARFVPVVRTFAPFVAGMGRMVYPRFLGYSFAGALLWIGSLTYAGYYFGNLPFVRKNFSFFVIGIVVVSILPGVIEYLRSRSRSRASR
jgi:membrane-associated protein